LQAGGVATELLKASIADGDRSSRTVKLEPHRVGLPERNSPARKDQARRLLALPSSLARTAE
jgi:hypothetical protein